MTEQPSLSFAGLVRQLRKEVKLTQEELAEAAGLSPRAVSDLERGINRTAHKNTAVQLATALGLADPVSVVFVAAARGRAPASHVLTALGTAGQKPGRVSPRLWNIPAGTAPSPAATTCSQRYGNDCWPGTRQWCRRCTGWEGSAKPS